MGKLIEQPTLSAGQMADDDVLYGGDMSATVGQRDVTFPLGALREYLGAGITVGVQQAAHGLSVGDVVRFDGTDYVQATADTEANAEAVGVVTAVETDAFAYQTAGVVSTLSGLTPGELYYLQDNGSLGTSSGTVEKPILIATSATSAVLILAISGGGGGGVPVAAEDVTYDNGASGLTAEDVQAAIDELASEKANSADLGTAAAADASDFATAAQGALADTALQPGDELTALAATGITAGYVAKADGANGIVWAEEAGGGGGGGGIDPSDGLVVVQHGAVAATARPTAGVVYWMGSVAPDNKQIGDLWLETGAFD